MGKAHWVTCVRCGRRFDVAKKGGRYIPSSQRYMCKKCYQQQKKISKAPVAQPQYRQAQAQPQQKQQSAFVVWLKKYWRIPLAVFFLIGGFGNIGTDTGAAIFGIVLGFGFLGWFAAEKALKKKKENDATMAKEQEIASAVHKCPNCGALTHGSVCEYCNTPIKENLP